MVPILSLLAPWLIREFAIALSKGEFGLDGEWLLSVNKIIDLAEERQASKLVQTFFQSARIIVEPAI